jgi:hypothetical protein
VSKLRSRIGLLLVAAVACAGTIAATTALADHATPSARRTHRRFTKLVRHKVSPALVRHFAIFRRHFRRHLGVRAATVTTEPAAIAVMLSNMSDPNDPAQQNLRLSTASAEKVSPTSSFSAWVIPGTSGACVMTTEPVENGGPNASSAVASCAQSTMVLAHGIDGLVQEPDGSQTLFALVPDGNRTVSVVTGDGTVETVPVVNDVVTSTSMTGFTSIGFRNSAGAAVEVQTPSRSGQ